MPALEVFAHALRFFKEHALQVCCGPIPAHRGRDPRQVHLFLSAHPLEVRSHFRQPLPSYLIEPAWAIRVLGEEVLGILPTQLGSPS